ncbi:MAG TPA: sigma-70 family RNA polymerase sigma factor, partial [Miltoncostaeaceae bacterium]|nr:sigma-70 family RNA polymerase sigma factor [Miltoncostaeaceae bacterium]
MTTKDVSPPTDDERRRAVCDAMSSAPGLVRYAARYTRSLQDAEDAYQRAMEIALTRAPTAEPQRFMAWLRTVVRNEALAVWSARRREGPGMGADVADAEGAAVADAVPVDVLAEWRERYRAIQDGLAGLTDAQRTCLMLQTAGASYERIRELTGFSLRKVERSVLEGRAGLHRWEVRLASGEACRRLDAAIWRVAGGQATPKEQRAVGRHVKHCGACRATLRDRRQSNEWLAALVPVALIGGQVLAGAPDPTPMFPWWERVADGATVRVGTMVHMAMELPGAALAKVGAATAAAVVAGAAALPLVTDAASPPPSPPTPVAADAAAVPATRAPARTEPIEPAAPARQARPHSQARRAAQSARPATRPQNPAPARATAGRRQARTVTAPATRPASSAPPPVQPPPASAPVASPPTP